MNETPDVKHCPICSLELPISEFGICRARKDGRNLYCKGCIRKKVTASRIAFKEYKASRKKRLAQSGFVESITVELERRDFVRQSPVDRVKEAIQNGARTQKEIGHETKLGKDEIGDAIANLLLWTHEIKTKVIEGTRMYFINDAGEADVLSYRPALPFDQVARKANEVVATGDRKVRRVA